MKLVELLAAEIAEWHEKSKYAMQDADGDIYFVKAGEPKWKDEWGQWAIGAASIVMNYDQTRYGENLSVSDDFKETKVTRAQWQAERDRQKGGEWKRHRAGRNQPVMEGVRVEVKLRCGDIQQGNAHEFIWLHSECDVAANIMSYRVISQPQAEEVEMKDTNIGTISYKVEIDTSAATHAIDELAAKWGQLEGPLKWRDCVIHCQAIIEDCEREIQRNVDLLDAEGLMMQTDSKKAMQHYVPDVDMSDWRNWKDGDIVEVVFENDADLPIGKRCVVATIEKPDYIYGMPVSVYDEDANDGSFFWPEDITEEGSLVFKFVSRP